MYENFYGLKERPFNLLPDPDFLYLSPQHKMARAYLEYGIHQRVGFVVLTGNVGTGKTTLIKSLLKSRERNQRLGVLYQTSVGAEDLLDLLLKEFGVRGHFGSRVSRLAAFNQFLHSAYARGEHVTLMVDEAQNLGPEALEELRLLSNLQAEKEPLLQVILVGQPGLRERLRHPSLSQLAQRVAVHYHLSPLNRQESKEYVSFRLARVGGSGIFTDPGLDRLFEYTQGVPRRLNAWCDLALVAGFAEGRREIDRDFIDTIIAAQGGSLEGEETRETIISVDGAESSGTPGIGLQFADNGLVATVQDLSGRLSRLEGLVLEMTSQLMPVMAKFLEKPSIEPGMPPANLDISHVPSPEQKVDRETPPRFRKSWWSRFWKHE